MEGVKRDAIEMFRDPALYDSLHEFHLRHAGLSRIVVLTWAMGLNFPVPNAEWHFEAIDDMTSMQGQQGTLALATTADA